MASVETTQADSRAAREETKYTLFASGDTMLAGRVPSRVYEKGYQHPLAAVKDLIENADIAMTNLECVVSTRGRFWNKGETKPWLFRAPPEMLDVLTEVGFDLAITANNHAMDYGPEALLEQREYLEAAGIAHVGSGKNRKEAARPAYIGVGDLIVAFIGLETTFKILAATRNRPGIHHAKRNRTILRVLKKLIAEARKHADLVVFSPHWGDNYTENPTQERIELAQAIIDLGCDAILGHSAHQLHGIKIYRGRPIIYDMGTFLFDSVRVNRMRLSAGFLLEFSKRGFTKLEIHPLLLQPAKVLRAKGKSLVKIQDIILKQTQALDPKLELTREGDALVAQLTPESRSTQKRTNPKRIHRAGITRRLPGPLRERKSDVVLDIAPAWARGFDPVELDNEVRILGARSSDAVRPGNGFKAEIALLAPGSLKGARWEASIKGLRRGGGGRFTWRHPIADGAWVPEIWKKGEIIIDRTLVRYKSVREGLYDLFYRMENLSNRTVARPQDRSRGDDDNFVLIGKIQMAMKGIPRGPAGVLWSGRLNRAGKPVAEDGIPGRQLPKDQNICLWLARIVLDAIGLGSFARRLLKRLKN